MPGISYLRSNGQLLSEVEPKARGRHRSLEAEASILKAALYLLERKPLRQVTTDAIARRAGVSKATIYKWWPNKSMVALDAYLGGMTERVAIPDTGSAELDFTVQLKSVTAFYKSSSGTSILPVHCGRSERPGFSRSVSRSISLCKTGCSARDVAARRRPRRDSQRNRWRRSSST